MTTPIIVDPIPKHHKYKEILSICQARLPLYLFGPTGSGKTHIFRDIAKELNAPFYKKLIGAQMSESSLLGYNDAYGKYVEGIVYKPYTEGGLLVLDEIDNGNPNTNLVVNGVCDQELAFPCGMRERHKDFIIVATANTTGNGATLQYVGRNKLDAAMLNRFVFIEFLYDLNLEMRLAKLEYATWKPNYDEAKVTQEERDLLEASVHDFWRLREAIKTCGHDNYILSQRNLLQQTRMIATDISRELIISAVLLRNLSTEAKDKIIQVATDVKIAELRKKYADTIKELPASEQEKVILEVNEQVKNEVAKKINELRNQMRLKLLQVEQLKAADNRESKELREELAKVDENIEKLKKENVPLKTAEKIKLIQQYSVAIGMLKKGLPPDYKPASNAAAPLPNWDEEILGYKKPN